MKSSKKPVETYEAIYKDNFSFGHNWKNLLAKMSPERILLAKKSLTDFTKLKSFKGKVFLDFGCGSGLFSLAAVELGAKKVISVDIDDNSIYCTTKLREKHKVSNAKWQIVKGSALDKKFVNNLPKADITYSWGVLHHTGKMYEAITNVASTSKKKGLFYLAIYNDFHGIPFSSRQWVSIKRTYNNSGKFRKKLIKAGYVTIILAGLVTHLRNPYSYIKNYAKNATRGMDFFIDVEDWLGGYPYEYATAEQIVNFCKTKGFELVNLKKTAREGCNEFLFVKN
jgi:2-polyprenyl-3-methyl-5-hydroxy-6-metoxy-1,4-benzoquinol methylase